MILAALIQHLRANLSVTRIYAHQAPQDTEVPAIIIDQESVTRERIHSGTGAATALITTEFEIAVFATSLTDAVPLAGEIVTLLENQRVSMSDGFSPETIHRIADMRVETELSGFDTGMERWSHSIFISITSEQ